MNREDIDADRYQIGDNGAIATLSSSTSPVDDIQLTCLYISMSEILIFLVYTSPVCNTQQDYH
jgi:hypothetical protein